MSSEAQIRTSLQIRKTVGSVVTLNYPASGGAFSADVTGTKGPCPGAFTAALAGTNVDLSQLVVPALCVLKNLDATNFVQYGIKDSVSGKFFPLGEILPGEQYVLRLSRELQYDYPGAGTGTGGTGAVTLHFKADTAAVVVSVEAFEK